MTTKRQTRLTDAKNWKLWEKNSEITKKKKKNILSVFCLYNCNKSLF